MGAGFWIKAYTGKPLDLGRMVANFGALANS
jgi:hypothetical protein